MTQRLLPTTRAQVSGHRFMRRRVEHGLVYGDIRMIHDPLASRRRATLFGCVAVLLIAGVMGLFAWMRPNPSPGEAPVLRAVDGSLFVRVDEVAHPVTNLTSARLIAGGPVEPARVGAEYLSTLPRGLPVGLSNAPGVFAPAGADEALWSVCQAGADITVIAGLSAEALGHQDAVLAVGDHREWVVTGEGRTQLPPATTPEGRVMRRVLGIDAATPRWAPPAQVLNALRELPPFVHPGSVPTVLRTAGGDWALGDSGGIAPITPVEARVLLDLGAQQQQLAREQLAQYPDAQPGLGLRVPTVVPRWVDPAAATVCVDHRRGGALWPHDQADVLAGAIALAGTSAATHFVGLYDGAVGVDSGQGFHVVATNGVRYRVPDGAAGLEVIGVEHVSQAPWQIVALLPEGPALTRDAALAVTY